MVTTSAALTKGGPERPTPATIENVLMRGDLSKLTEQQRLEYYNSVCRSTGLNPLTRPFEYIVLNNKLVLYARKDATDQLRKINSISVEIVSQNLDGGLLTVHVRAKDADGRTDEDIGSVAFGENVRGEIAANLRMKAVTKAKRRVTLSICGLGMLDETEIEDIPASAKQTPMPTPELQKVLDTQDFPTEKISEEEVGEIIALADSVGVKLLDVCRRFEINRLADLPADKFPMAIEALNDHQKRKSEAQKSRDKIESGPRK